MSRFIHVDEWKPRGIETLEENAATVVRSDTSYSVIAGPGAGKTELLAQRASYLLETGVCPPPRRILAISLKRDAAKNLRERVQRRSGEELTRRFDSYTFDAFAKGILDQFLLALPEELRPTPEYDIVFSLKQCEIEEILRSMAPPASLGVKRDLRAFARKEFFEHDVPRADFDREPSDLKGWVKREFWRVLQNRSRSQLSFPMITRLAGKLLHADKRLVRAYRRTYSHVFLDEFQDTTSFQYWLTKILFKDTSAVLTAVGDPHQRIMGWAGALKTAFRDYKSDFVAKEISLLRNHRSSIELAPLVRFLAQEMHASVSKHGGEIPSISPGSGPPRNACSAHIFANENQEAKWVAAEVKTLLASHVLPREIALLARMKAADYTRHVLSALQEQGIAARVEDVLQDLLAEPIVQECILGIRALTYQRPRRCWAEFREVIGTARGLESDDRVRWDQLEVELEAARMRSLAAWPKPDGNTDTMRDFLRTSIEPLLSPLRARYPQYTRGTFYEQCLTNLSVALGKEAESGTWEAALEGVEGVGSVPILTIHKSKGLEYHAVFFIGLEDNAFWNFSSAPIEEVNAFYVAVSRATRTVVLTFAKLRALRGRDEAQSSTSIERIYALMRAAEVQVENHAPGGRPTATMSPNKHRTSVPGTGDRG
jgi:DNA helicase-2/ATP-dependent DNA helicase PcrA